jgi:hypothetical protein
MKQLLFYANLANDAYSDSIYREDFESEFMSADTCQAHILTNETTQYVVFRGTDEFKDWVADLSFKPTTDGIQSGFNKYADLIIPKLIHRIDESKELIFIGHSLGGAIALILSVFFNAKVITFGCPRVSTLNFIKILKECEINHIRVLNRFDYAPYIPMYPYCNYGKKITLRGNQVFTAHKMMSYIKNIEKSISG